MQKCGRPRCVSSRGEVCMLVLYISQSARITTQTPSTELVFQMREKMATDCFILVTCFESTIVTCFESTFVACFESITKGNRGAKMIPNRLSGTLQTFQLHSSLFRLGYFFAEKLFCRVLLNRSIWNMNHGEVHLLWCIRVLVYRFTLYTDVGL